MQAGSDPIGLSPAACRIDAHVFSQLMEMAGVDLAPSLLEQMRQDLWQIAIAISAALGAIGSVTDYPVIRRQSHILAAIAGAAGAGGLQRAAQALEQIAHGATQDPSPHAARPPDLHRQGAVLFEGLYALIGFIDSAILPPRPAAEP